MLRKDALVGAIVYYDGKCNHLSYDKQKSTESPFDNNPSKRGSRVQLF